MIILLTADNPVLYSLDNGITLMAFMPGEHYSVPDYAARAMIAGGWARLPQLPPAAPSPEQPPRSKLRLKTGESE